MEDIVGGPVGLVLRPASHIAVPHGKKEMGGNMGFDPLVLKNAFYRITEIAIRDANSNRLSYRVFFPEQFGGDLFREDDRIWFGKGRQRISIGKGIGEDA